MGICESAYGTMDRGETTCDYKMTRTEDVETACCGKIILDTTNYCPMCVDKDMEIMRLKAAICSLEVEIANLNNHIRVISPDGWSECY